MTANETFTFDTVLKETGFVIKDYEQGLYTLQHKTGFGDHVGEEVIQTNGYNLLESLRRLTTSDLAKAVLA